MIHAFDVEFAERYGLLEALIFNYICYWVEKNEANRKHFHDGKWWTYNSASAFAKQFPYATPKRIRTALDHLKEAGLIVTGDYNEDARDRTLWYALAEKGKCILLAGQMQTPSGADADAPQGTPLPINNTINNTINNSVEANKPKRGKGDEFVPPTAEEVRAYCQEQNCNIDPEYFVNYYASVGWVVGKGKKMKDWKATVKNWAKRNEKKEEKHFAAERTYDDDFFTNLENRDRR